MTMVKVVMYSDSRKRIVMVVIVGVVERRGEAGMSVVVVVVRHAGHIQL